MTQTGGRPRIPPLGPQCPSIRTMLNKLGADILAHERIEARERIEPKQREWPATRSGRRSPGRETQQFP
jgi:hypothetical protein